AHPDRVLSGTAPDPKATPVSSDAVKPSPTVDPPKPLLPSYKATDQPSAVMASSALSWWSSSTFFRPHKADQSSYPRRSLRHAESSVFVACKPARIISPCTAS